MRKATMLICLIGLALANVGCAIVLGYRDMPHRKHVITIDGEVYVVDVKTRRARRIEVEVGTEAPIEVEVDDD